MAVTVKEQTLQKSQTNRFANVWLFFMLTILGLTAMVTAVLVAWPLVAYISSRLFG